MHNRNISTFTQIGQIGSDALALKAPINCPTFAGTMKGITKEMVQLSKVDDSSDLNKPISDATQPALNSKAPNKNPTFTGTAGGLSKAMAYLSNVDDAGDLDKPISNATQLVLDTKQIKCALGEIPTRNTNRLLDHGDNKFRAIRVNRPLSVQTTTAAYFTIQADCYTTKQKLKV